MKEPECVRWKRIGAARIHEETKDLSREELLAWWEERNREFAEWMAELRAGRVTADTSVSPAPHGART